MVSTLEVRAVKTPEWCEMKRGRRQTWHVRSESLRKIAEELDELRGNGGDWVGRGVSVLQELAAAEHDWWHAGRFPAIRASSGRCPAPTASRGMSRCS